MAKRYLDPKNDIVFKRIFGEHPQILRSFLNALLPLPGDGQIVSLEYLPAEQVPQLPLLKNSIVDVRCRDQQGRQFIVEMQINWTSAFLQRVLFNASKAYVRQLERGEQYELLQPVTGLSLLDDVFDHKSDEYYHHYQLVKTGNPERIIKDLQLVFIELPKFKPTPEMAPLKRAWLRFLRETGAKSTSDAVLQSEVASEAQEIQSALELSGEASFTPGELEAYDRYWDAVSSERTLLAGRFQEGKMEGVKEGEVKKELALLAKFIAQGMSEAEARRLIYDLWLSPFL